MKSILVINLAVVVLAALLPNDFLTWHSYMLYGLQLITMMPYLVKRAVLFKNIFLPTFFVLIYFLLNLAIGSYLVPREYGWNKDFATTVANIRHYNLIVPFLLLSNLVLFLLTATSLRKLTHLELGNHTSRLQKPSSRSDLVGLMRMAIYFVIFFAVSFYGIYSAFSLQLALLIVHFTEPSLRRKWYRYAAYAFYLVVLVAFSYDNKREIVIILFWIIFVEAYYGRFALNFTAKAVAAYASVLLCFFALVLSASIVRGYGDFPVASALDAMSYIPRYIASDMFVDGVTDNLELNYNYGSAVTAIDLALNGRINYQYGASLMKLFFLPIPRELFTEKPESIMQIFTKEYAPSLWAIEGSMPVISPSEMFLNFHYFGLFPFALIWAAINGLFMAFHRTAPRSIAFYSSAFLFITVLIFARGSGIELYVLYYLVALPVFFFAVLLRHRHVSMPQTVHV